MSHSLCLQYALLYVSSRFSSNSEAFASELLENLEEMGREPMTIEFIIKTHGK